MRSCKYLVRIYELSKNPVENLKDLRRCLHNLQKILQVTVRSYLLINLNRIFKISTAQVFHKINLISLNQLLVVPRKTFYKWNKKLRKTFFGYHKNRMKIEIYIIFSLWFRLRTFRVEYIYGTSWQYISQSTAEYLRNIFSKSI